MWYLRVSTPVVGTDIYHTSIRKIIKLSNDITKIKMGKSKLLKISREFEKMIFFLHFLASDISLNNLFYSIKFYGDVVKVPMEGTVSQNFYLGLSFYFMKSRILSFKKWTKVF